MAMVRACPNCGTENLDTGEYLRKCSNFNALSCGYCRHGVMTSSKCDDCGEVDPTYVQIDVVQGAVYDNS